MMSADVELGSVLLNSDPNRINAMKNGVALM